MKMNLVYKSDMGTEAKYKLIGHLHHSRKVRGQKDIQKVAETGMGLRKGSLIRQPPAWLTGSQARVNTQISRMEVFQKGCYKSNARGGRK